MTNPRSLSIINRLLAVMIVLYPFLVYFGLTRFSLAIVVVALAVYAGVRLIMLTLLKTRDSLPWVLTGLVIIVLLVTWWTGQSRVLLGYPVLVNAVFFCVFAISYLYPPTIVERMARRLDPDFTDAAIPYTRKVTLAWCVFFIVNGAMAGWSMVWPQDYWALYNGLISYGLIGFMFAGEWCVRKRVKRRHG
jgi:uncharacterized membrane protein